MGAFLAVEAVIVGVEAIEAAEAIDVAVGLAEVANAAADVGEAEAASLVEAGGEEAAEAAADAADAGEAAAEENDPSAWAKYSPLAKLLLKAALDMAVQFGILLGVAQLMAKLDPTVPANAAMQQDVNAISTAIALIKAVIADWSNWLQNNATNHASFGVEFIDGTPIERYFLLKSRIDTFVDDLDTQLTPAITNLHNDQNQQNVSALKVATILITDDALDICNEIIQFEPLMVAAGLQDHKADITAALAQLQPPSLSLAEILPGTTPGDLDATFQAQVAMLNRPQDVGSLSSFYHALASTLKSIQDLASMLHTSLAVQNQGQGVVSISNAWINAMSSSRQWLEANVDNRETYGEWNGCENFLFVVNATQTMIDEVTSNLQDITPILEENSPTNEMGMFAIPKAFSDSVSIFQNASQAILAFQGTPELTLMIAAGYPCIQASSYQSSITTLLRGWGGGPNSASAKETARKRVLAYINGRNKTTAAPLYKHLLLPQQERIKS